MRPKRKIESLPLDREEEGERREAEEVMAGTVDLTVVLSVLLVNYKEATVYFALAVISGFLISCSCILGKFLNSKLNPAIPAHYLSRAGSLRSHRGGFHDFATMERHAGSWTRPTSLGLQRPMPGSQQQPWVYYTEGSGQGKPMLGKQSDLLSLV